MVVNDILQKFPAVLQNENARNTFSIEFDSDTNVYEIPKAPVRDIHEVQSNGTVFTEGTDYDLVRDSDDLIIQIDWSPAGDDPVDGAEFTIDQTYETFISRWTGSHEDELEDVEADINEIITSHHVDQASGQDLNRIGAIFGELGQRDGRTDQEYRLYLKSVVPSFTGRGSRLGLKLAVAAAVEGDISDVEIVEDQQNLEYALLISNVDTEFLSSTVNELAELADPSGVELDEAIIVGEGDTIVIDTGPSVQVSSETGLGGGTLTLDGNSTLG